MTISRLATSQYLTDKHWEYRDPSQVKYIIPHYMAGRQTGAWCAQYFVNNGLQNSANYCIGYEGDISCNVPEEYGAWTSSFSLADKYAITIEVSNAAYGDATIPVPAQQALIKLMVDLIKRYPSLGGRARFYPADESEVVAARRAYRDINAQGNILLHKWTSAYGTDCPGWHMTEILPELCEEVNLILSGGDSYTVREAAQKMIDSNINGADRINWCKDHNLDPKAVQAEIDLMLGKDKEANLLTMIELLPNVKSGSTGYAVEILQEELKRMGYYDAGIDGIAGPRTVAAILALQRNWEKVYAAFKADGVFGPKSWKRLFI